MSRQVDAFIRYSRGSKFPFFDNLRAGIDGAPQADSYEGGVKVSAGISGTIPARPIVDRSIRFAAAFKVSHTSG